jgi:hypothetical protein
MSLLILQVWLFSSSGYFCCKLKDYKDGELRFVISISFNMDLSNLPEALHPLMHKEYVAEGSHLTRVGNK